MDDQGKPQRKREGHDVVGEREEQRRKREGEGPSQVLPPWFPSVFVYDLDVYDWDNKLDWSSRVMPPGLSAAISMFSRDVSMNPNACDVSYNRPLDPEALKTYNQQISMNPYACDVSYNRPLDPEALKTYNQQVSMNPYACDVSYNRPLDPEALKTYNQQVSMNPYACDVSYNRPLDPEALKTYNQQVSMNPYACDVSYNRPLDPEALKTYSQQVSMNPYAYDVSYNRPLDPEALKTYNQQVVESEGFDISFFPGISWGTPIVPLTGIKESPSEYEAVVYLAKLAIKEYNVEHNEAYEFIDLERANARVVSGSVYYITFQVKKNLKAAGNGNGNVDGDDTPLETFQARVWKGITETVVHFCRPKPIKPQN